MEGEHSVPLGKALPAPINNPSIYAATQRAASRKITEDETK
jgi:hypothetical protein